MRLFDPRAELAKIQNQRATPATSATIATQPTQKPPQVAEVAEVAAPPVENSDFAPDLPWQLIDRYREKVAILEVGEGLSPDRATWLAALAVFPLPKERADFFDGDDLRPQYRQVSLAIGAGLTVTFHSKGRVSFEGDTTVKGGGAFRAGVGRKSKSF